MPYVSVDETRGHFHMPVKIMETSETRNKQRNFIYQLSLELNVCVGKFVSRSLPVEPDETENTAMIISIPCMTEKESVFRYPQHKKSSNK